MTLLTCDTLTLGYDTHAILSDISFTLNSGDYLCIVGSNGAGKSTLLKTLLGLLPPLKGSLHGSANLHAGGIGYLPQKQSIRDNFPATVREIVRSGCLGTMGGRPFYTPAEKKKATENMVKMGVRSLERAPFASLSGGQKQRVLLARALCATKDLLILDEPTAGLDPGAARAFYALIQNLNQEDGLTILMVSHDLEAALHQATHVLHLGTPVFFGTCADYQKSSLYTAFSGREGGF